MPPSLIVVVLAARLWAGGWRAGWGGCCPRPGPPSPPPERGGGRLRPSGWGLSSGVQDGGWLPGKLSRFKIVKTSCFCWEFCQKLKIIVEVSCQQSSCFLHYMYVNLTKKKKIIMHKNDGFSTFLSNLMYGRCASARPGSLRTSRATAWTWTSVRRTTGAVRRSATTNQAHTSVRSSTFLRQSEQSKTEQTQN